MVETQAIEAQRLTERIVGNVARVIVGRPGVVEMAVIALLSEGHLLIEDAPGAGKTMLARSLAKSVNCTFKRIQFTPDLLPSDITGVTVYNQRTGEFEFRAGPVKAQFVLADEINRATPRVQSALLECMEERQVTVDGITHKLPRPFHVLATKNPIEYEGIFPLPETQLDRFTLRISLGYPSPAEEVQIMDRQQYRHPIEEISPVAEAADLVMLQETVKGIFVDILIREYIASLVEATRKHPSVYLGASPRGSLALFRTAQARALMQQRSYVLPDDIKAVAEPVLAHRLVLHAANGSGERGSKGVVADILDRVPVPGAVPQA